MFDVNPESLRAAAQALAVLPEQMDEVAPLGADHVDGKLDGSAVGHSLGQTTSLASQVRETLKAGFTRFAELLEHAASTYRDDDMAAAAQLAAVTDLIPTGAHDGS
ncbi:hypothetical protein [Nocardia araoensis]|uniref:hypothetical protein n=1 Tax=Nocardia araoensis TaxID=228600 RepID=UPI0012F6C74F|nr:hypothetical protein [Nocardia araoensis]